MLHTSIPSFPDAPWPIYISKHPFSTGLFVNFAMPVRVSTALRREIFKRHRSGQSNVAIQRALKVGRRTVQRWIAEGKNRRPCWGDLPRPGRPLKLSAAQIKAVRRAGNSGERSATSVARTLGARWGCTFSKQTVSRIWHSGRRLLSYKKSTGSKSG